MIGYNRTEPTLFLAGDREAFALDDEGLQRRAKLLLRDQSERVIEEFRGANPGATPSDLFFLIGAEYPIGAFSRKIAQRRSEQGRAPGYLYRFELGNADCGRPDEVTARAGDHLRVRPRG
jgi:para-nitrobenzyl esterase